jgi:hypothetical protein
MIAVLVRKPGTGGLAQRNPPIPHLKDLMEPQVHSFAGTAALVPAYSPILKTM